MGPGESGNAPVLRHMRQQRRHVEPLFLDNRARVILHSHDLRTSLSKQLGGRAAHIAKALHRNTQTLEVMTQASQRFTTGDEHATTRRLDAAQGTAQWNRLARDHAGRRSADVHRIRVHHPRHDLAVGIHIGRRNVLLRANDDADFTGVASGQALQLFARQLGRLDTNAPLGAAIRQTHGGVLDGHPGRQRHHFF